MAEHLIVAALLAAISAQGPTAAVPTRAESSNPRTTRRLATRPTMVEPWNAVSAPSDTLTSNHAAYRVWLRRKIDEDIAELHKITSELIKMLDPAAPADPRKTVKHAEKVVKLSHNVWNNLQMRRPTRERPKEDPAARPRGLAAARSDAETARTLVRQIAEGVATEQRAYDLDASRRVTTLERLEQLERIGLQLKIDLATNQNR